jgi:hypothetical protein
MIVHTALLPVSRPTQPASDPLNRRFLYKNKLRQATLILPKTGERIRRSFTLRGQSGQTAGVEDDETQPLLSQRANSYHARQHSNFVTLRQQGKEKIQKAYAFAASKTGQSILKCSIAYLLGCMATFVGPIRDSLGKNDGKHMVATITVYFHPARSMGSMEEATLLAIAAFSYAAFISFTSMAVSFLFGRLHLTAVGHAIVLVVFCGGGLGFVGWLKQRLGNPLVNVVGCDHSAPGYKHFTNSAGLFSDISRNYNCSYQGRIYPSYKIFL